MVGVWKWVGGSVVTVGLAAFPAQYAWHEHEKTQRASEATTNLLGIFSAMRVFGGDY